MGPITCLLLHDLISQVIRYVPLAHSPNCVQFVDVAIFQLWPTLQFVLLAPISLFSPSLFDLFIHVFHAVEFLNRAGNLHTTQQRVL